VDTATALDAGTFLTEAEMVTRYRGKVTAGTLKNWRSQGRGPPFVKIGRQVLYPINGLEAWERSRTMNRT
jgi:hypothetical protein